MKYYVVSDIHGYYDILMDTLTKAGFFAETQPCKLIICGDLLDRGQQAKEVINFVVDMIKQDKVILIKGNHEDLLENLLLNWENNGFEMYHHIVNGTVDTTLQISNRTEEYLYCASRAIKNAVLNSSMVKKIIPAMVDYFETDNYVFVHGWLPCLVLSANGTTKQYKLMSSWRDATIVQWEDARWINGMVASSQGNVLPDKTVVCGHYRCSYGHAMFGKNKGVENAEPCYDPFYADGIIAIDASVARSGKINCIVIED